jgi:hypothetical protein
LLAPKRGYFIAVTSVAGHAPIDRSAAYCVSKTAVNRLVQVTAAEEPNIKIFALDPGDVATDMMAFWPDADTQGTDTPQLPACTVLRLTSGKEDWLNGRYDLQVVINSASLTIYYSYVSVNWDLDEVARIKDKILQADALIPTLSKL